MNGIELSKAYFETYGRPMLESSFPELLPKIAVGLCGSGSECFRFDDACSQDHDFEPGFCLFLPDEQTVDRKTAFALERAYAKLPDTFEGYQRQKMSPVGGNRHGVIRWEDFLEEKTGTRDGNLDSFQWISVPEQSLAELTNGELFLDGSGQFTELRSRLSCFPEDIRKKKMAGALILAAQSGLYNYGRCLNHRETGAAMLAVSEYVCQMLHVLFLYNRRYQLFYKWVFRAYRTLPVQPVSCEIFEQLLTGSADGKQELIQLVSSQVAVLLEQEFDLTCNGDLGRIAYAINDKISDGSLRNLHILSAV